MLFGGKGDMRLLSVDSLLNNLKISVGGMSVVKDNRNFANCNFGSSLLKPVKSYVAKDRFDSETQVERNAGGRAQLIHFGNAHYLISEADEVVRMD